MANLYHSASLFLKPSYVEDGKLFAMKPTNGDGDFDFSRDGAGAGTGSYYDINGTLITGHTNFLLHSDWDDVGLDTAPTGWTSAIIGSGTYDAGASTGQVRFTAPTGSDRAYIISTSVATTGIITTSVYVDTIHTSGCTVLELIGRTGTATALFYLENNTIVPSSTVVTAGNSYAIVWSSTGANSFRFGVGTGSAIAGDLTISQPQVEKGLVRTEYMETGATEAYGGLLGDEPRINHDPANPSCANSGALLEGAATNYYLNSEYINNFSGTANHNAAESPEGNTNAVQLVKTAAGDQFVNSSWSGTSLSTSTTYSMSFRVKYDGDDIDLRKEYNNTNDWGVAWFAPFEVRSTGVTAGTPTNCTTSVKALANDWYECQVVVTTAASITPSSPSNLLRVQGASGESVLLYGLQFEEGVRPSSYIPTYGASVTRATDELEKEGIQSYIGQTAGTVFCEYTPLTDTGADVMRLDRTTNSTVVMYVPSNGTPRCRVYSGGAVVAEANASSDVVPGVKTKMAAIYDEAVGLKFFVDGDKFEDLTPFTFTQALTEVEFGNVAFLQSTFNGTLGRSIVDNVALSDGEAIELTTL